MFEKVTRTPKSGKFHQIEFMDLDKTWAINTTKLLNIAIFEWW